jgi:NADH:ubiquinone oxidoreductase subunit 5 (subunit L)/multisubunit Na+/H+ antiporter MnhA subunit
MIKAGLLGWLRFLPLGEAALPEWGGVLVSAGLAATLLGALAGVAQNDAKATLAYSSISQMGFMTVAVGIGLGTPPIAGAAVAASAFYAAHHALAKGALFLGVGVADGAGAPRSWRLLLVTLAAPAFALAGAPFTSGLLAKDRLKDIEAFAPGLPLSLTTLLFIAGVGTTLLLARFFLLVSGRTASADHRPPRAGHRAGRWGPLVGLVLAGVALGLLGPGPLDLVTVPAHPMTLGVLVTASGPIVLGLLIAWLAARIRLAARLPPGDILLLVEGALDRWASRAAARRARVSQRPVDPLAGRWYGIYADGPVAGPLLRAELWLTRWQTAALLLIVVVGALFTAAWLGSP